MLFFFFLLLLGWLINKISLNSCYRNTAKTFYAASIFFEIISQFGPLQPDVSFTVSCGVGLILLHLPQGGLFSF